MAYVSAEMTAKVRARLKDAFPGCKFGVTKNSHGSAMTVVVKRGPDLRPYVIGRYGDGVLAMLDKGYVDINPHWYHDSFTGDGCEFIEEVLSIMNDGNHDHSDPMTDYFNVGWYIYLSFGTYDTPYEVVNLQGKN